MRYAKFIEAAEQFAAENGIVIGGASAARLLLSQVNPVISPDDFQYDFYSGRGFQHAKALGDLMWKVAPDGLGHYTTVSAKIPDQQWSVIVDTRELFTVTALPTHKGVRLADVVIPTLRPARFARGPDGAPLALRCMGAELCLIRLYSTLCDPGAAGDWADALADEAALRAIFESEIRGKIDSAVKRVEGGQPQAGGRRGAFISDLLRGFATDPGRVLVGPMAVAILTGDRDVMRKRMQVVSVSPLDLEAERVAAIAKRHGLEITWRVDDPKVPTDTRLRRLRLSITEGRNRRDPFLDVYNAAGHELIPFVTLAGTHGGRRRSGSPSPERRALSSDYDTIQIGTPFALMRFWLCEMWTMQVLMEMKVVSAQYGRETLHDMLDGFVASAAQYVMTAEADYSRLFPLSDYIGRAEDPMLSMKRLAQANWGKDNARRFQGPYIPAQNAKHRSS